MEHTDLVYRHALLQRRDHVPDDAACLARRVRRKNEPLRLRLAGALLDLLESGCGLAQSFEKTRAGGCQGARRRNVDRPDIAQRSRAARLYGLCGGIKQVFLIVEISRRLAIAVVQPEDLARVLRVLPADSARRRNAGAAQAAEQLPQDARVPRQVADRRQHSPRLARHLPGEVIADGPRQRLSPVGGEVSRTKQLGKSRERLEADGGERRQFAEAAAHLQRGRVRRRHDSNGPQRVVSPAVGDCAQRGRYVRHGEARPA